MTDPIRQELAEDLHAVGFKAGLSCDYHHRPKEIEPSEKVLAEAIKLVDHPQLTDWPDRWQIDATRCSDHSVEEIEELTKGFHEALVEIRVKESNNVVSVDAPASDDVRVLAFSPAPEGCHPMLLDQQLMDAAEPGDTGLTRWNRVQAMLARGPAEPFREHIESLIERSHEIPPSFK